MLFGGIITVDYNVGGILMLIKQVELTYTSLVDQQSYCISFQLLHSLLAHTLHYISNLELKNERICKTIKSTN